MITRHKLGNFFERSTEWEGFLSSDTEICVIERGFAGFFYYCGYACTTHPGMVKVMRKLEEEGGQLPFDFIQVCGGVTYHEYAESIPGYIIGFDDFSTWGPSLLSLRDAVEATVLFGLHLPYINIMGPKGDWVEAAKVLEEQASEIFEEVYQQGRISNE